METIFKDHLKLNDEEIKDIFENAFIVLDTNILINFYRYSTATRDSFIQILSSLKTRLYLPYQIGKEFFSNRLDEINAQKEIYTSAISNIKKMKSDFENKNRNPFLLPEKIKYLDEIINELESNSKSFDEIKREDKILDEILKLYNGCIGEELTDEELQNVFSVGRKRYERKIPPGYKDDNKPEEHRKYGDYIIWMDLIKKSKELGKPCLFITDDKKEDWWLLDKSSNIIMPRPELRKEFFKETNNLFYCYLPFNFLDKIKEYLQFDIDEELIEEVKINSKDNTDNFTVNEHPSLDDIIGYQHSLNKKIYLIEEIVDGAIYEFVKELEILGYECYIDKMDVNKFYVACILPNIFDIERKFDIHLMELLKHHSVVLLRRLN